VRYITRWALNSGRLWRSPRVTIGAPTLVLAGLYVTLYLAGGRLPQAAVALAGGLLCTSTLGMLLLALLERTRRDQEELRGRIAQLETSENRLRQIVDAAQDAFLVFDEAGVIAEWSGRAQATFGWDPAEAVGRPLHETLLAHVSRAFHADEVRLFLEGGDATLLRRRSDVVALDRDGREFPAELSVTPVRDGQSWRFYTFVRDVSSHRDIEEALRKREALLREAQRLAQIGSWEWNAGTDRVTWSDGLYRLFGLTHGAPATFDAYLEQVHVDDRERVRQTIERARRRFVSFEHDCRIVRADGAVRWIHASGEAALDDDGKLRGLRGCCQDITRRKEDEAELLTMKSALENAVEGISRLDADGCYVTVNHAYARMLGYEPDHVAGAAWETSVHRDDRELMSAAYERMLRDGRAEAEARGVRRDGSVIYMHVTLIAHRAPTGALLGHYRFMKDVTERRRAEEQVRQSLHEKEVLLQEVHHRVKNNLQVICSLLNLQSHAIGDASLRECLRESQERVRSMALIHERLYRSSQFARVGMTEYVQSLLPSLFRSYEVNPSSVVARIDVQDIELPLDRAVPFGLILNELIVNALKHGVPAGGEIRIDFHGDDAGMYTLEVSDSGPGFRSPSEANAPSTLGMELVTTLAEQLGGRMTTAPGPGARVRIRFPEEPPCS